MLKEIRESRGMSQQDLADKTGIPKRMVQAYEQGYRNINGAKLSTLLTFANVLNCPIDQIVTDESLIARINKHRGNIG
jgi:transcriptional regulator with XRE-family HTH domain